MVQGPSRVGLYNAAAKTLDHPCWGRAWCVRAHNAPFAQPVCALPCCPVLLVIRRSELSLLLTGFLATLSSIGLARFAYTALMPQMVLSGWFNGEQAAYLGAANLLGYLLGAIAAAPCAERLGGVRTLVWAWWAVALSFAASSWPQSMAVFSFWRFVAGVTGGLLMVLGPSIAMSAAAPQRRAFLGPLMFSGVGMGALFAALIVPGILPWGLGAVWWVLALVGAIVAAAGVYSARRLPAPAPVAITPHAPAQAAAAQPPLWTLAIGLVFAAYMLDGFGFVPHTVFWVDYLTRELHLGSAYAATQWALFGLGAMAGPMAVAFVATRWGWWRSITGAYLLKGLAIGLPLVWVSMLGHSVSSFAVGALSPGMSAITSGYLMQLIGPVQHKKMWGYATAVFALLQATAGYVMAWLYASSGSYRLLFVLGCSALLSGCVLVALSRPRTPA